MPLCLKTYSALRFFVFPHHHRPCIGSSVSGHDESPGDDAAADAADPPAAGAFPPAAPGPAPAAAGCNAAAGTHTPTFMHRMNIVTLMPPHHHLGWFAVYRHIHTVTHLNPHKNVS